MKVLDAFGVPDPASLVRDVNALGAEGIGGYAYDDDVLSANPWTGAHVDAVRAAGKAFLPIITLRTSSPVGVATLGAALRALNCHSGPVGWDVENTATPPYATLQTLVAGVRALGYGPMTGYFWPPLTWRPVYGDLFDSHWWGSGGAVPAIPPGWNAIQYGQEVANGTAYDVNVFDPVIFGGTMFHGAPDFDAVATQMQGVGGTANPSLTYFNELRNNTEGTSATVAEIATKVDALQAGPVVANLQPVLDAIAALASKVAAIEAALRQA